MTGQSMPRGRRLEVSLPLLRLPHLAMHTIDAYCQCKFVFLHIYIWRVECIVYCVR